MVSSTACVNPHFSKYLLNKDNAPPGIVSKHFISSIYTGRGISVLQFSLSSLPPSEAFDHTDKLPRGSYQSDAGPVQRRDVPEPIPDRVP